MHDYADDLQIYLSGPAGDIDKLCKLMNINLLAINSWAVKNKLVKQLFLTKSIKISCFTNLFIKISCFTNLQK